jgi:hypothetical protein
MVDVIFPGLSGARNRDDKQKIHTIYVYAPNQQESNLIMLGFFSILFISVPELCHFETDTDPQTCTTGLWIRILLFPLVAFKVSR